jgi:hypothetical protein
MAQHVGNSTYAATIPCGHFSVANPKVNAYSDKPLSSKILEHRARLSAASCNAVVWSSVLVRAYPYFIQPILTHVFDTRQRFL